MREHTTPLKHILVVDDEPTLRDLMYDSLTRANYAVSLASSGREAIEWLRKVTPDLLILDVMMPGMDGITTLSELWSMGYQGPTILLTGMPQAQLQQQLTRLRDRGKVDHVFVKPVNRPTLLAKMDELFLKEEAIQHSLDSRGEGWYLEKILAIPEEPGLDLQGWQGWVTLLVSDTHKPGHDLVTYFPRRVQTWKVLAIDNLPGLTS